jgi:lysylphosphatidylglycerol synthetase-like protein (DUF2156 family)
VDKQKKYVTTLALLLMGTVVSLAALAEQRLDVYVSLFTVCYFASTALFQTRKRSFDFVGGILFLVFCVIVGIKILEIIR